MWQRAETVNIGGATLLTPSSEDILAHLVVRSAFHGNARVEWLSDIKQWIRLSGSAIDWERFLARIACWHRRERDGRSGAGGRAGRAG